MRFLLWALVLCPDTGRPRPSIVETRWFVTDFVAAGNEDQEKTMKGEVLSIRTSGYGESCLLRLRRFGFRQGTRVSAKMRWTECGRGVEFPSLNLVFDPPALGDVWWNHPIEGGPGAGKWAGGRKGFVFHFSGTDDWKRFGVSGSLEDAPHRHKYSAPRNQWVRIEIVLERKRVTVYADGVKVAECDADLSERKTFAFAFGDQTMTRVELDEFRIE